MPKKKTTPAAAPKAFDIIIIGAGPAGLTAATAFGQMGLRCAVLEQLAAEKITAPRDDGREIALTHRSVGYMRMLGLWDSIPAKEIGAIQTAHVLNDDNTQAALEFSSLGTGQNQLAYMVPNFRIREATYRGAAAQKSVQIFYNSTVTALRHDAHGASVTLQNGEALTARLVLAADSRFSKSRAMAGIDAEEFPFGRTMIVAKVHHPKGDHHHTATEWFQRDRTLAMLPLAGRYASAVLTVPHETAKDLMALDDAAYAANITQWFQNQYGPMQMASARHAYPLVAVYAKKFFAPSFAVIGDAAVGMHPVTAHGFNFGLASVETLAAQIAKARSSGQDFGSEVVLTQYHWQHRQTTRPLYLATNAIVKLYTRPGPVSMMLRRGLLRAGRALAPVRGLISRQLTQRSA